ncbi:MAG: ABC transporter substrate-binding protein [Thermomicrobiaceae bacterium]
MTDRLTDLSRIADSMQGAYLSRRQMLKSTAVLSMGAALLAACAEDDDDAGDDEDTGDEVSDDPAGGDAEEDDEDTDEAAEDEDEGDSEDTDAEEVSQEERSGGELQVALIGEPPTLDIHNTSATVTTHVTMHMYENLFTWDEEFQAIPELVDTHEVSDDGLLNTLTLREGVMFHNGDEMTAEDVHASIDRWANVVGVGFGEELMGATEEMRVVDDYTLEFEMTEAFGTFVVVLARQNNGCAIYPQSIVSEIGTEDVPQPVGTGPYQFVEWQADQHIIVERFEDYVYRDEEPNGYGGRKHAYLDAIRFIPVPDEAARVSGLQAGDYHFLEEISTDQFETLEGGENIVAEVGPPAGNDQIIMNMEQGLMTDVSMRRAVQAAIDADEILTAAWGEDYYRADPGHMWEETVWHTTVGEDLYNIGDPELAADYLEEAGYDGEPVRLITTEEYADMYSTAIVLEQQLEDAGMTVEVQVFDWATLLETRDDMAAWDLAITGFSFRVDPTQLPFMRCEWGGRWCSDEKVEIVNRLFSEVEFEDRFAAWEELQELIYEQVPMVKTGEGLNLLTYSASMQNVELTLLAPAYWNVWLEG